MRFSYTKGSNKIINQVQSTLGICGGSASGKTTVAKRIIGDLGVPWVCLLSMDSFYKVCCKILLCLLHIVVQIFPYSSHLGLDVILSCVCLLNWHRYWRMSSMNSPCRTNITLTGQVFNIHPLLLLLNFSLLIFSVTYYFICCISLYLFEFRVIWFWHCNWNITKIKGRKKCWGVVDYLQTAI